jgi:hypothetical protein
MKGASVEAIAALPAYKFKLKGANDTKSNKEENELDSERIGEGVLQQAQRGRDWSHLKMLHFPWQLQG